MNTLLFFVGGGALLIVGAELLVRGASGLAIAAGISPLVVGLTVVAVGTSAPEMAVTVGSAYSGEADLALGNVVGSNIFNVLFILGVSALIAPLVVARQLVRVDVPIMVAVSVLTLLLALDGAVGRADGLILFVGIAAYTVFLIRQSRKERPDAPPDLPRGAGTADGLRWAPVLNILYILAGLGLLVVGARWLVRAAVATASALGISELVIGLTIVAAGTSLPEVATSILATIRGERDIAVGNVVGSNIFNLLAVLGLGALVAPSGVPVSSGALSFDIPIMIAVAVAALPIFFTGFIIARWEGFVFLAYYVAYTAFLVLQAAEHELVTGFGTAMVWFVLPLTGLTLVVGVARNRRVRERRSP
ncbi:MAG: calcium/sodium antiporter [Longimicrobiales bacterium]|nr:calcium/sodium antiporter [Longimicrobiales bacterium]